MEIEHEEVRYSSGSESIMAYLSRPTGKDRHPGIILVHEIFGLDEHTRRVADRIAAEGYVVLAPHLFSSERLSKVLTTENIGIAIKFMMSIPPEKQRDPEFREKELGKLDERSRAVLKEVNNVLFENRPVDLFTEYLSSGVDYLNSTKWANGKVGSAGFCFGGGMSINLACTGKTDASIIFYGENPNPVDRVKNVKGAVMGLYGGEDARINSKIGELAKALVEYKKPFTIRVFPGAHHAFFNDTRPQTYNKTAADESWLMLLKFFEENLK